MSHPLIVLDEAEEELIEAEKWYERQRPGLGREFRTAIDETMERLLKAPLAASPMVNVPAFIGARRIFVKRFPYSIVFIELGKIFGLLRLPIIAADQVTGVNDWNHRWLPPVSGVTQLTPGWRRTLEDAPLTRSIRRQWECGTVQYNQTM